MSLELSFGGGDTIIRSVPVAGAVGAEALTRIWGLTINDWFYVTAIIYTVVQCGLLVHKHVKQSKYKDTK